MIQWNRDFLQKQIACVFCPLLINRLVPKLQNSGAAGNKTMRKWIWPGNYGLQETFSNDLSLEAVNKWHSPGEEIVNLCFHIIDINCFHR
jgi:hypothetical protein